MSQNAIEKYQIRKNKVLKLLTETAEFFVKNSQADKAESFNKLFNQVKDGTFSIVVVGEFSAGKSTFLNALMGDYHLPAFSTETTATVNFLKSKALATDANEIEVLYNDNEQVPTYFKTADKETIEAFVTTKSKQKVVDDIKQVNLYLDSPFLNDGVTLVDSPGLNGVAAGHREITEKQIEASHASIMMFSAHRPGSKSEFEFIGELQEKVDTIFYVLNGIDAIKLNEQSVEDVVDSIKTNFHKLYPDKPMPEIWPIAALPALAARSGQPIDYRDQLSHSAEEKQSYLTLSRIAEFEERLLRFITQGEKAKQELLAPVNKVYALLTEYKTNIEHDIDALQQTHDSDEVSQQLNELIEKIEQVEAEKSTQKNGASGELKDLCRDLKEQMGARLYKLKAEHLNEFSGYEYIDDVIVNIGPKLSGRIQQDYEKIANQLLNEFSEQIKELAQDRFSQHIDQLGDEIDQWSEKSQIKITSSPTLDVDSFSVDVGIDEYQKIKAEQDKKITDLRQEIEDCEDGSIKARKAAMQLDKLEDEQKHLRQIHEMKTVNLGPRPGVSYHEKTTVEKQQRGGFLGAIGNFLIGDKDVEKRTQIKSTDERDDFDKQQAEIIAEGKLEAKDIATKIAQQSTHIVSLGDDEETLELKRKRYEAKIEQVRTELADKMKQFGKDAARENKKQLVLFKSQYELYLEDFESEVERTFKQEITKSRGDVSKMIDAIVLDNFNKTIERHKSDIALKQRLLDSSEQEKNQKIAELTEQAKAITAILKGCYADIKSELETAAVDTIQKEAA